MANSNSAPGLLSNRPSCRNLQLRPCDLDVEATGVTLTAEELGLLDEIISHFSEIDRDMSTSLSLAEVHFFITQDKASRDLCTCAHE